MTRIRLSRLACFAVLLGFTNVSAAEQCNNGTEFMCVSTRKCIPLEWICDGVMDCADTSDERRCDYIHQCSRGAFNCNDGDCILAEWKCNGLIDCHNGRDELACEGADVSHIHGPDPLANHARARTPENRQQLSIEPCDDGFYRCKEAGCIHMSMLCDQQEDCPLGDDEPDTCPKAVACPPYQLLCDNGDHCVPKAWWCDGEHDCDDGTDELNCDDNRSTKKNLTGVTIITATKPCGANEYRCRETNTCIDSSKTCDGTPDCPNGDDEGGMCGECRRMSCSHDCRNTVKEVMCVCPEGMTLDMDHQTCINDSPCRHHSRCTHYCQPVGRSDYVCKCDIGFTLDSDQHHCIPQLDANGGELLISVGNEIRVSPLHVNGQQHSTYSVYSALVTGESMYHLAWDAKNQNLWMGISGHFNEWRITNAVNGLHRPLRRGFPELSSLQYDWISGNVFFLTGGRTDYPTVRACTRNMMFCSQIVRGTKSSLDEHGRKKFQIFRGLALHPKRGLMCWIEIFHLSAKIKCGNMDGTDVHTFEDHKLLDPTALTWDTIRNDLFIADQGNELIERINYDTRERAIIVKVLAPYAMEFFNGMLYYSESDLRVVKSVDVSSDHRILPHIERTLPHKTFGLAVNHTLIQNSIGGSACSDIECAYVCVVVHVDGRPSPRCICPVGYERDESDACYIRNVTKNEDDSYLDLTYMTELCDKGAACGVNGECVMHRDETTQEIQKIDCSCEWGYTGYGCELVDKQAQSLPLDETSGSSVMPFLLLLFAVLILVAIAFFCLHEQYEPVRRFADSSKAAVVRGSPRFLNSLKTGVESGIDRIRTRGQLRQGGPSTASFTSPIFTEGTTTGYQEIPSSELPAAGNVNGATGVRAIFDNFDNPSFDGTLPIEVSYTRKFSSPGRL